MKPTTVGFRHLGTCGAALLGAVFLAGAGPPRTGPETEKRFPPLQAPPGFKATLFACDPLIEYPSVIALGPRPGTLFVAADYMTGLGTEIIRRDEIRLIEDTDGDGYADRVTVYAKGFNSIQGLAYYNGAMFVMHAPHLTVLRDTDGDGIADERRDLLTGLGLPPEQNPVRLHCANGVVPGHDGWLYLALGDHGCDVRRPEGDRLVLKGGGILRCRPDGRDLHVFATGLRNIYDVALDEELNVFVRDNENDGGDYKIRVCHSFFGADHGYPYLYYERPDEALAPLADLGLGSSAGGVCYLETAFPAEYRGNLFFCEWGRSVMRYQPRRAGAGFTPLKEVEFAAGAANDPYGFKPTDLVVDRDGSLLVADWADGQQPRRGRGRIYRIAAAGNADRSAKPAPKGDGIRQWIARLDSASYHERSRAQAEIEHRGREGLAALTEAMGKGQLGVRARLHTVWLIASAASPSSVSELLALAASDPDPRVQAQAVRAIADLADPLLTRHRLDAGPGDSKLASRLAALAKGCDPRVLLEVVIALSRLRWPDAPSWLGEFLNRPDAVLSHAAMQTLRRSKNWPAILRLLDEPGAKPIRAIALRAVAGQSAPQVVDGLIERLRAEREPARRREYADALTRVYQKPGAHSYWGYRPAPRPANTVPWERTRAIADALDRVLADPDRGLRLAVLRSMQREQVPVRAITLARWLENERDSDRTVAILKSLRDQPAAQVRHPLAKVVSEKKHSMANRLAALAMFADGLDTASEGQLLDLAGAVEDGAVLADILRRASKRPKLADIPLLVRKMKSSDPDVRAAAVEAVAELRADEAKEPVRRLLDDGDSRVRRAAAAAAGKLAVRAAAEALLKLARDADAATRRAAFDALRRLHEVRVVPLAVAALADRETELTALECVTELGGPAQATALVELAKREPSGEILTRVVRALNTWASREGLSAAQRGDLAEAVAQVQGSGGILLRWHVTGPLRVEEADQYLDRYASPREPTAEPAAVPPGWRTVLARSTESPVNLGTGKRADKDALWLSLTELAVPEPAAVEFLAGGNGTLRVWLNGRLVHKREQPAGFRIGSDRFPATLRKGMNRLLVQIALPKGEAAFHLGFRRKSSTIEREQLIAAALARDGDPERGRKLFLDAEKSQCTKCHRIGDQGERIGPELTGVGSRFSRIYIIESILEPNRVIAPSYQTLLVTLKDGRTFSGVKITETDTTLTLGDNQGQKHVLAKSAVEEQHDQAVSTMPEGLEKRLTTEEFVDLIAFLVSQKERNTR